MKSLNRRLRTRKIGRAYKQMRKCLCNNLNTMTYRALNRNINGVMIHQVLGSLVVKLSNT